MIKRFLSHFTRVGTQSSDTQSTFAKAPFILDKRIALVLLCNTIFSCRASLAPPPMLPEMDEAYHAEKVEEPPGLSEDAPPVLTIHPGDAIHLRILSTESYEPTDLWVDARGQVHVPFGSDVIVGGLGLQDAGARIETAIHQFDRYARVTIDIQSFAGHRVIVSGAVDKPGNYEARPGARIADMIAASGGARVVVASTEITDAADMSSGRIVRDGKTLPVSLDRAIVGEPLHNVYVRPGDIIYIPYAASRFIPILGDVHNAQNVRYHRGLRLTEALAAAGGANRTADTADIRVIRGPLSRAKVYRANLDDVITGETTDIVLAPGDVVFVTEHWFASATDVLNRLTPLLAAGTIASVITTNATKK